MESWGGGLRDGHRWLPEKRVWHRHRRRRRRDGAVGRIVWEENNGEENGVSKGKKGKCGIMSSLNHFAIPQTLNH